MQKKALCARRPLWMAAAMLLTAVPWAAGQSPPPATVPPAAAAPAVPEFKWPDFAMVTKDMQAIPGLVTLYRYQPNDPTKDQTRLLCQIPRSLLKQDLLLATSFSRGEMAGFQWSDFLVRFELLGRQVVINTPDMRYVQTPGRPVTEAISRTYTEGFLGALPIVTMSPSGDPVVDLGSLLLSTGIVSPMMGSPMTGMRGMPVMPRRELSQYTKVKSFPDNALIEVELAVGTPTGAGQRTGVAYSLRRLPDLGSYRPRLADERVGYFTTERQDWNIKHSERETMIRFVNRWDLKKKDPTLEMSPPDKPIVFIVEKTVPFQWRKYVAEGIKEWNKAFEKLGIVDAIVVQQQTDDNEFAQIDPEDARYNFIRWIVTGTPFAMGPSRADPRTGQILDADIIFDDSMIRSWSEDISTFSPQMIAATLGPETVSFLRENPEFLPAGERLEKADGLPNGMSELSQDANPAVSASVARKMHSHAGCCYAAGMKHQLAFLQLAAAATAPTKKIPDKLIGEIIQNITTHEVGHTLGLRHNFKASSWLGMEEIRRRRDHTDEPTTSSVMDYNALLFFSGDDPTKVRHFTTPVAGPYDYWAIEYGYRVPSNEDEKTMLGRIAMQGTQKELAYATDEDTMGLISPDPYSNRFDMSEDPIAWAKARASLCDSLLKDIRKWAIKSDEPGYYLRSTFLTLMYEKARNTTYVSRLVGGQQFFRNRSGDPQAKPAFVLVEPQRQRDAIAMLGETVFQDGYFATDPDLLNALGPSRWGDWGSSPSSRLDWPVHQMVNSMQGLTLMNLCSPQVLQRVYDAELKSKAEDRFTAAEMIKKVRELVWNDVSLKEGARYTDAQPMLSSVRRNLQRQHLQYLMAIADSEPGALVSPDLQSMARFTARELGEQIGSVLSKTKDDPSALDFASRAHLTECKSQIDRVMNAPYIKMPRYGVLMSGVSSPPQQHYQQHRD